MIGPFHIFVSRQVSDVLAKIAPGLALLLFISSVEVGETQGAWTDVWRITLSAGLAVFITLVGVIYNDMKKKQRDLEDNVKDVREKFVPRTEYGLRHDELKDDLKDIKERLDKRRRD
jgi:hypothetical protein